MHASALHQNLRKMIGQHYRYLSDEWVLIEILADEDRVVLQRKGPGAAPRLQAEVLGEWLRALDRPAVHGVLVWRWLSDPNAGGPKDTDFTVQGKPAEDVLRCVWSGACARAQALPR